MNNKDNSCSQLELESIKKKMLSKMSNKVMEETYTPNESLQYIKLFNESEYNNKTKIKKQMIQCNSCRTILPPADPLLQRSQVPQVEPKLGMMKVYM